jgi:AraC family transcriptional regulator of adaptative response/methylated-DNA-[protein]-cysteine methyltransferase
MPRNEHELTARAAAPIGRLTSPDARWSAVLRRDAAACGAFVYAVKTTGVVCRPACASRTPRRENVAFYDTVADAERAGFRPCRRCHAGRRDAAAADPIAAACALLAADEEGVRAAAVAAAVGMTPTSMARAFRAKLGVTPRQYRQRVLAARARTALAEGRSVTEAIYAAGYSASSRFYEGAGRELGMAPRDAARGGRGQAVSFTSRPSSLGTLGLAWTPRGLSDLFFVEDARTVAAVVRRRWPAARRAAAALPAWLDRVVAAVERPARVDVPLDVQGTAFQERVWQVLRAIGPGETRSYAAVAAELGMPRAQRAVARAIGSNPITVLVPCHRVVAADGGLGGYRWGTTRKAELLRRETAAAADRRAAGKSDRASRARAR